VPQELIQAIASKVPIVAYDAEFQRASVAHQWNAVIGDRRVAVSDVIEIATKLNPVGEADGKFVSDAFREGSLLPEIAEPSTAGDWENGSGGTKTGS
jgi:hypothetical protein